MSSKPKMSRQDTINSKCTMWHVLIQRGEDERAGQLLKEIHSLQWEAGRAGEYDWLREP